ncbi:dnaJ homolog subfamily C member 12 isoform X1 [Syngnathus scovelli]|uniref:dnaJ homolog subfamily C member 12 isoform X1 n=1 Tax=Syngnathus scovelli TaxID=161590 RepID=UPI002110C6B8|nr:dnaJ homolog subfamily C member 12 isoform X1 [Syngnathus scovelli]
MKTPLMSPIDIFLLAYVSSLSGKRCRQTEQIINEYKIRALACHPDKHQDNPNAVAEFQKLQEAKEVLCNDDKRKNYDLWKRSGVSIPFHDWQALNDSVKMSMHWAVKNKKEPMLEAANAETPITHAEELHSQQEAPGMPSSEGMLSSSDYYYHRRFRWAADSPSYLLQKFRNYDI